MAVSCDSHLREQARRHIADGRLPSIPPRHTLAGSGSGCACAVCDQTISPQELEYEIETGNGGSQHFHIACYTAWFMESAVPPSKKCARDPQRGIGKFHAVTRRR